MIKNNIMKKIIEYTILILVLVAISIFSSYIAKEIRERQVPPIVASQYPDYDAIKGPSSDPRIVKVSLTSDCPLGGCKNDKSATVEFDGIHKSYKVTGKFARAYLFIEALVDYNRPLTAWDDFYFKINGSGGHLINDLNALPTPAGETSKYLYDLRSVSYYSKIEEKQKKINKQENINLFVLLQPSAKLDIDAAISSDRPGRIMREVSIYYECFEGSKCAIEEIK